MTYINPSQSIWFALCLLATPVCASEIVFDLPPTTAALPVVESTDDGLVTVHLRLSSMIESPDVPRIDQWMIRCQPRDFEISIADYSPKTETGSDLVTPIQVKQTDERTNAVGFSVDGGYHSARGTAGVDQSNKQVDSFQFERAAPVQAVSAAGTINRGRGVYFKLRWTALQVLEGEKVFSITMQVPPAWRGGMMDVQVIAQSQRSSFGWDREPETLGAADFVVGMFRQGDSEAAELAQSLADAEHQLRKVAEQHPTKRDVRTLPGMLRHVATKLDLEGEQPRTDWMKRLLSNRADPHLDREICKLPMPVRVAVLDYVDVRDEFNTINRSTDRSNHLVAKPAQ